MTKGLKALAIVLAIAVTAITLYKGGVAIVNYIEEKATTEVENRQLEESAKVQQEAQDLIVDLNKDLTIQIQTSQDFFSQMDEEVDQLILKRQQAANVVELPDTKVTAKAPVTTPKATPTPTTSVVTPVESEGDRELLLAWEAFCKLRPLYKDCAEGIRP